MRKFVALSTGILVSMAIARADQSIEIQKINEVKCTISISENTQPPTITFNQIDKSVEVINNALLCEYMANGFTYTDTSGPHVFPASIIPGQFLPALKSLIDNSKQKTFSIKYGTLQTIKTRTIMGVSVEALPVFTNVMTITALPQAPPNS